MLVSVLEECCTVTDPAVSATGFVERCRHKFHHFEMMFRHVSMRLRLLGAPAVSLCRKGVYGVYGQKTFSPFLMTRDRIPARCTGRTRSYLVRENPESNSQVVVLEIFS